MSNIIKIWIFIVTLSFSFSFAQTDKDHKSSDSKHSSGSPDHIMIKADDLKWGDAPASLPAGSKVALLEGDPSKKGPFTIRVKAPANYSIKPHWHPNVEHISVISGELYMGLGETYDESKAEAIPEEGFAVMQTGTRHFAFTKDKEVTFQLHGIGPWDIHYVNSADDPRKQGKAGAKGNP